MQNDIKSASSEASGSQSRRCCKAPAVAYHMAMSYTPPGQYKQQQTTYDYFPLWQMSTDITLASCTSNDTDNPTAVRYGSKKNVIVRYGTRRQCRTPPSFVYVLGSAAWVRPTAAAQPLQPPITLASPLPGISHLLRSAWMRRLWRSWLSHGAM